MTTFLTYLVIGLVVGCVYAVSASGLVVTYTTSGIFNFAHGAIGMVAAYCYWQLTVAWGWPVLPAILVVVLVGAPLFGALVERVLMRRLEGAPLEAQLAATVGLLVFLIGVANLLWNPTKATRSLPKLFPGHKVKLVAVYVDFHELTVVVVAILIAVALRLFFSRTRTGIAMRAVVDNSTLTAMAGARPQRIAQLAWALGAALAALAGVLLAPLQTLDIILLTLVSINAFTAVAFGRLRSLPLTVVGAFVLGLAVTFAVGYLPVGGFLSKIQNAIPMVLLFVVLIVLPHGRLAAARFSRMRLPRVASLRESLVGAVLLVAGAVVLSGQLSAIDQGRVTRGLVTGLILLSLVLLTGYGGQVSLAQMTFVGVGAYAMGHLGHGGNPLGLVVAVALAAGFGAAVALPTLRLRGLYLALATLAFAQAMDYVFFNQVFGAYGGGLKVARLHLPLVPTSDGGYFVFVAVVVAAASVGLLAVRRGRYGRRLMAMHDSQQACATLGVNISWTKLVLFAGSAGLAGLAGALYGGQQHVVTPDDFVLLNSLVIVLLLLIGGRNTMTGALLGGMTFAVVFPIAQDHFPSLSNIQFLLTGLAAIAVSQNPNGIGGQLSQTGERLRTMFGGRRPEADVAPSSPPVAVAEPLPTRPRGDIRPPVGEPVLEVRDVVMSYGGIEALKGVDLVVARGQLAGLIGPNGAGKTTLFNVVTGLERPTAGDVILAGRPVGGLAPHARARLGLARTFQRLEVFGSLTVRDNVRAAAEFHRAWARDGSAPVVIADNILERVGLQAVADVRADSLPTGLARLVEVGRALAAEPEVLLLDEPGSGLDQAETEDLAQLLVSLRDDGMAILLVEHDVDLVMRVCDPIHVLDFGRIIASGSPNEVQASTDVQAAYLGVAAVA